MDDVVQESYLRLWKARAAQEISSTKAFLFTVARRFAINVLRKNGQCALCQRPRPFMPRRLSDERPNVAEAART